MTPADFNVQALQIATMLVQARSEAHRSASGLLPVTEVKFGLTAEPPTKRPNGKTSGLSQDEKIKRRRLQIAAASRKSRAKRKREFEALREENAKLAKELETLRKTKVAKIFETEDKLFKYVKEEIAQSIEELKGKVALKSGSIDKVFSSLETSLLNMYN